MTSNGYKVSLRVEENVLKLAYGDGSMTPLLLFSYSVVSSFLIELVWERGQYCTHVVYTYVIHI